MSFECPYYLNDICELNGKKCTPAKGKCILKDRYMPASQLLRQNNKSGETTSKKQT